MSKNLKGNLILLCAAIIWGLAFVAQVMPEGKDLVGVEYKISLMRALSADTVLAVGKVIKMGRQLVVADVEAYNQGSDKIAAKMIFTGMLIDQ